MWQSWHQTLHPLANHWCSWWSSGQQSCTCGPIGELSISWWFVNVLTLYVAYQTAQIAYEEPPSVRGTKKKVAVATKVCTFEFECMSIFQYIYSDMYWWLFVPSKRGCLDWPNPLRHVEYFDSATYRNSWSFSLRWLKNFHQNSPQKYHSTYISSQWTLEEC